MQAFERAPVLRQPLADSIDYAVRARAIAAGSLLQEEPFYRAPLYPYLLAPFYRLTTAPEGAVVVFQVVLGLAILALTASIARRLFGHVPALLALLLLGLYGPLAGQETKLLATTLGIFLTLCSLHVLIDASGWARHLLSGFLLGLAALVRPNVLLVLLGIIPIVLVSRDGPRRRDRARTAALLAGLLVAVAPATLHNLHAGDLVPISSNGGMTFYHGNNIDNASGLLVPGPMADLGGNAVRQGAADRARASELAGRCLRPSQSSAFWFRQGLRDLASDPGHAARLLGQKVYRFVGFHEYADNYSYWVERKVVGILRLFVVPFPLLLIPAVAAVILRRAQARGESYVRLFALLGFVTCVIFYVGSRYRCESAPALAILAGSLPVALAGVSRKRALFAATASLLLLVLAFLPPGRPAASQDSVAAAQWAAALERDGRPEEARALYAAAAGRDPSNAIAWARRAALEEVAGGAEAGIEILDAGIASGADGPLLRRMRGSARIRLGRLEEAEVDLRLALAADPADPTVRLNLAACLIERRAEVEAAALLAVPELDGDPIALYYRGLLEMRAQRWERAVEQFSAALAAGARDPRPGFLRAMAWLRLGRRDEARSWIQTWLDARRIEISPDGMTELLGTMAREPTPAWIDGTALGGGVPEPLRWLLRSIGRAWKGVGFLDPPPAAS